MQKHLKSLKFTVTMAMIILATSTASFAAPNANDLQKVQQDLKALKSKTSELDKKSREIQSELEAIQNKAVKVASKVQKNESRLSKIEHELSALLLDEADKKEQLKSRHSEISRSITAMVRLSMRPPETVIIMPGEMEESMIASKVLSSLVGSLKTKAENLQVDIKEIQSISQKIAERKSELETEMADLKQNQEDLEKSLEERKAIHAGILQDLEKSKSNLTNLSKKSQNLQELISKIETDRKQKTVQSASKTQAMPPTTRGKYRMPVQGRIVMNYGDRTGPQTTSKGFIIKAREQAQVTSPANGEVVFSGPFKGYGKILIIRHGDNNHSLISGMQNITVEPGQKVLQGEPIGRMGTMNAGQNELYIELRQSNKPVDPSQKYNVKSSVAG